MAQQKSVTGIIVEESQSLTLDEFCQVIQVHQQIIIQMVEYHLLHPEGDAPENWRFNPITLKRAKTAASFYHDLGINMAGVALALDLLNQIENLQYQVDLIKKMVPYKDIFND